MVGNNFTEGVKFVATILSHIKSVKFMKSMTISSNCTWLGIYINEYSINQLFWGKKWIGSYTHIVTYMNESSVVEDWSMGFMGHFPDCAKN